MAKYRVYSSGYVLTQIAFGDSGYTQNVRRHALLKYLKDGGKYMKIATCTVSLDDFGKPNWTNERIRLLSDVLSKSRGLQVDLLCLPGGYLMTKSILEKDKFSHAMHDEAKKYKIAIAIGIDTETKDPTQDWAYRTKENTLPWFAICWSPNEDILHYWRQRSVTSRDQWHSSDDVCAEVRTLPVLNGRVEVLMCGEIFNERIRNGILSRKDSLTAVVDLAHTSAGFRVWAGMKKLAEGGLTVLCSVHADRRLAQKYCYTPKGSISTRIPDKTFPGFPRLELKVWSLS